MTDTNKLISALWRYYRWNFYAKCRY